jgi:hypothetical protein
VVAWQRFLLAQGFDQGGVDGVFGAGTETATKAFQKSAGLTDDGVVGPITIEVATSLGFQPAVETPAELAAEPIKDFSTLVKLPAEINRGVSAADQATMLSIFGRPGEPTRDCSPVTQNKVINLLVIGDVGPFRIRGIRPAVEAVQRALEAAETQHPELHAQLGTEGMLCCRRVRGGRNFSNHSWGTAVDLKINGKLDIVKDGLCQAGLFMLAPFFNAERFFWGAGFPREDSMHFEASRDLIGEWKAQGLI